jgi:pimeloyl-ACP methyl ester carboxylesterase
MKKSFATAAVMAASFIFLGCGNGDDNAAPAAVGSPDAQADVTSAGDAAAPAPLSCTTVVKEEDCDKTLPPFVFVHGTYGSGDNFAHIASLLGSNGYCQDRIVAVEYNSLGDMPGNDCTGTNTPAGCGKIDAAITKVLAANPTFTKVVLAGHSQGTLHATTYLQNHADRVSNYINFSSPQNPNVGAVQTLSISSQHDLGGHPNHVTGNSVCTVPWPDANPTGGITAIPDPDAGTGVVAVADGGAGDAGAGDGGAAACNVLLLTFTDQDHFALAASTDSFVEIYKYLTGKAPKYTTIQCGDDPVTIEGLSETFADNVPVTGKLEVREVTTPRADGAPDMVIAGDPTGQVGPLMLKRGVYYEFKGFDASGKLIGYQYFSPFMRSNRLVRFLTPASSTDGTPVGGAIASMSTDHFVRSPNQVDMVARWSGGAFRQDLGASLKIDGNEVLTSANSGDAAFATGMNLAGGVVGLFMYDANKNGKSDLGLITSGPFLSFTDVFVSAKTPNFVELSLTPGSEDPATMNDKIVISNYPSDGALINIFFQ